MIKLTIPSIDNEDMEAVLKVISSGQLVQGEKVNQFEHLIAEYVGTKYAVAVSNCTAALHLSLLSLDVEPGDLVLVTAYSYTATANVIELCRAIPIFIDILPDTFNIDPEKLKKTLISLMSSSKTAKRVKAIIPVHTFGYMANMPSILEIANEYNIPVIEDAACALGASIGNKKAGSWGKIGCFSFHPRKAITTGEGGMITTNDPLIAKKIRALRNHGQDPDSTQVEFIMPGFNYRLTDFQGALGVTQFSKLSRIIDVRRKLAKEYNSLFFGSEIITPLELPDFFHIYQSYVILIPRKSIDKRNLLIRKLRAENIETNIGTWNMPLTKYYREKYGYKKGDFGNTDLVFSLSLSLPLYEKLTHDQQLEIFENLFFLLNKSEL